MYYFILLPKYIYLIENMYLYIHTCIYYTCDMILPPPPQIPTYFLYVVYMTTSVKFFYESLAYFFDILWQNYTSKFMYTGHLSQRFHCSNLFTQSQKLIVFNFEKKNKIYKYSVHTYILFLLHGTKSKLQEYEE